MSQKVQESAFINVAVTVAVHC